ncbi:ATP-binding protein [Streptomyces sp. NBC_00726]|uniref:ATP-binding protein n=1 Tax=Streptomyces sp. NBC_00726 TaxID=2903674 RepID=UPI003870A3D0
MPAIADLSGRASEVKTFTSEPDSVFEARSWATKVCETFGIAGELLDTYRLLVSEVVTNAVMHGQGADYTVVVCGDGWVEVWDAGSELPHKREHGLESEGGRGLDLLELLAPGYRVVQDDRGGKCVRFLPEVSA